MSDHRDDGSGAVATVAVALILLLVVLVLGAGLGYFFYARLQVQQQRALVAQQMARAQVEKSIAVERAAMANSARPTSHLTIDVNAEGLASIDGQFVDLDQLTSIVTEQSREVTIHADPNCSRQTIADIMRRCLESGVTKVHIETSQTTGAQ